jgi:hypothetical protein
MTPPISVWNSLKLNFDPNTAGGKSLRLLPMRKGLLFQAQAVGNDGNAAESHGQGGQDGM